MRPRGPDPFKLSSRNPRSRAMRRAAGVARGRSPSASRALTPALSPWPIERRASSQTPSGEWGRSVAPPATPSPDEGERRERSQRSSRSGSGGAFATGGAKLSPSATIQPMQVPTGSTSPSEAATNFSTPEAGASTSIAALSVSISNSVCPLSTCAPSAACQRPMRPDVMSISTRGMTISIATPQISPSARRRAPMTMSSTCGTAAFSRTGL